MTDRNVRVVPLTRQPIEAQAIEIVERKGIGHPDSICDGIAEHVAQTLAREYLERVGTILHFNTDETQLVAGEAAPAFGGGEVIDPIYVLIVGRATKHYQGQTIPTQRIALRAAREYLSETVPELTFGEDVVVDVKIGEGSGDLQEVFDEEGISVPMANDTSYGVGHAPLSETERIVYEAERRLNEEYAASHPELGADVKIMGKREGDEIDVTVAAAMIDAHVPDMDAYVDAVEGVREFVTSVASEYTDRTVRVHVNTADDVENGSIYLTVTGVSAEQGDDGSVGRGNRANGLITPNRSMSMEASSGKNPVNHIGKIYNLLSTEIAETLVEEVDALNEIHVRLLSQIGRPIDQPHVADIHVRADDETSISGLESEIEAVVDRKLAEVTDITKLVIDGELTTF